MQFLRKIAFPITLIYALVIYLRNLCYDIGVFKSSSFSTPTICIGNLSVGGTGKTPMIEYILRIVKDKHKTAVLSRGYRRRTKGYVLATNTSTVKDLGDEPYQIYLKFKGISLAVDEDRRNGITSLDREVGPDLILLDDAFQHRRVKPALAILLTTYSNLYINDCYLPTGDLRDSKKEARRANIIAVTKCPADIGADEKHRIVKLINPMEYQRVLFSKLVYSDFLVGLEERIPLSNLTKQHFSLVTAIANPKPLIAYLESLNFSFEHFKYPDHHFFNEKDIESFSKNELIITTEKDFTKLVGRSKNVFYLEVKHEFLDDGQKILEKSIEHLMFDSQPFS